MIKFLDLAAQYQSIQGEIDKAIKEVINQSAFIRGPFVAEFENAFAAYQRVAEVVGVANGTDALELSLEALDLAPGSEVIVPANTFIATAEAVTRAGHRVVFCDVNDSDYTIDPNDLESRITPNTAAIIAVHLYGHPCQMDELKRIAEKYDLKIIEDCAQAHGAEYIGQRVGGLGDVGTFSFFPGKNLGAYGDAGAVTTKSVELARKVRMIANHGREAKYLHEFEGRNSRLDGLQAAILSVKLRHLDKWTDHRNSIALHYNRALEGVGDLKLPRIDNSVRHAFHLFVIRTSVRDDLARYLGEASIQTGVHYPVSLPNQPAYAHLSAESQCPAASKIESEILSLPIGEHLSPDDVDYVCQKLKTFYGS